MSEKRRDEELDSILSEINESIKKEQKHKEDRNLDNQLHFTKISSIIEQELSDEPQETNTRHIEVSAVEKVVDADETPLREAAPPVKTAAEKRAEKNEIKKNAGTAVAKTESSNIKAKSHVSKRQVVAAILGVFFTFFVVVGVVSTVLKVIEVSSNAVNSSSIKSELVRAIYPLVIVDAPEFDDPTKLDNAVVLSSALWSFIISDDDKSQYTKDDLGTIYLPDVDIETYIRKLFGSEVPIKHQSIDDPNFMTPYSSESKIYLVNPIPQFLPYTPRIDKVTRDGDIYTLTVSYVAPNVLWGIDSEHAEQTVSKIMEFRVKKNAERDYQILSLKFLELGKTELSGEPVTGYDAQTNAKIIEDINNPDASDIVSDITSSASSDVLPDTSSNEAASSTESDASSDEESDASSDEESDASSDEESDASSGEE